MSYHEHTPPSGVKGKHRSGQRTGSNLCWESPRRMSAMGHCAAKKSGHSQKRKFLSQQSLSIVPQFRTTLLRRLLLPCRGLPSPSPNTVNVVRFHSGLAHGLRETPLYRIWSRRWSCGICCGSDVGGRDAAARTARKPTRDHRVFRKRPTNSIRPGAGNFGLRAPQERRSDLDGRSAQQERSSEPAAVTNSSCRYHGDFYGIHNGGQ